MMIVDSQVHLWPPNTQEKLWADVSRTNPAPGTVSHHHRVSFETDEMNVEMEAAGVARAILIPPVFTGDSNDFVLEAARLAPNRFAAMGRIAIDSPSGPSEVDGWLGQQGMLGMRLTFFSERHKHLLTDGSADWLWSALEQRNIPLAVAALGRTPEVAKIAERHPGLRIAIDHLGIPFGVRDSGIAPYVDQLISLKHLPNVSVKASTLPSYSTETYPFPTLHREIQRVVEAFGPRRVFWGSDLTRLPCSYEECVGLFTEALESFSSNDLEWVMGRAVLEWLAWE